MILADENIHSFIIKTLRDAGFEVVSVKEDAKGIEEVSGYLHTILKV
jgi:hypothetical protein